MFRPVFVVRCAVWFEVGERQGRRCGVRPGTETESEYGLRFGVLAVPRREHQSGRTSVCETLMLVRLCCAWPDSRVSLRGSEVRREVASRNRLRGQRDLLVESGTPEENLGGVGSGGGSNILN